MSKHAKQSGITFIGFIFLLALIGFFLYIGMRIVPVYMEYYGVVQAMNQVQAEAGSSRKSGTEIRNSLQRKFDISYIKSVKQQNIKLIRTGAGNSINIKYEVRDKLLYNVDFIATFDKTVALDNAVAN